MKGDVEDYYCTIQGMPHDIDSLIKYIEREHIVKEKNIRPMHRAEKEYIKKYL